jgi:3-hydroxyacyl-[acyl-carrier-protein] dehydratase
MPPPAILDPTTLDFSNLIADRAAVEQANPHRHEFSLVDGVLLLDLDRGLFAGYHDVRTDAWWVRGHVPGRPLFPGVLMIEAAAQLSSYVTHKALQVERFVGLTAVNDVKYRGTVAPPSRFVVVGQALDLRPRRTKCATQGFVNGNMVFEAVITGMLL